MPGALWVVVGCSALLALAGCLDLREGEDGAAGFQRRLDAAMGHLASLRDEQGRWAAGQVPLVAEAAHAARLDLAAWPEPVPVARQVAWPGEDVGYLAALRPLHAEALVAAAAGDRARLVQVQDRVLAGFDGRQFGEPGLLNDDAYALLVLGAAQATWTSDIEVAVDSLLASQSADGGWSWAVGGDGEVDMTGMVLAGIAEAGAIHRVPADRVLAFLAAARVDGGGYALAPGGQANCDSTVWAVRAQGQLGLAADRAAWGFLLGLQGEDGGFAYLPGQEANVLCTAEAAEVLGMAVQREIQAPAGLDP